MTDPQDIVVGVLLTVFTLAGLAVGWFTHLALQP
jgi:hypothetical protein